MRKKLIPFAYANSLFEVDPSFFVSCGVKTVFLDLDNTLAPYSVSHPDEKTKEMINHLKEAGIRCFVTSNNRGKRVHIFCEELGVERASMMAKPFSFKLKKLMASEGIKPEEAMLIGDQIQTDVKAGNGAKVRTLLLEPLDPNDEPPWTRFNRLFDRPKRKKMAKLGLLKPWKEA